MSTTLRDGEAATFGLDAFGKVAIAAPTWTIARIAFASYAGNLKSHFTEAVRNHTFGPYGVPGTITISVEKGVLDYTVIEGPGNATLSADGALTSPAGGVFALSELTDPVTLTATGSVLAGPGEYGGFVIRSGTLDVVVYDALSATGTAVQTESSAGIGAYPWLGTRRRKMGTGCWAVITGTGTIDFDAGLD